MAKGARSSSNKNNNQRKAANVFGPVEAARTKRLSARLLEIAKQPKPDAPDVDMEALTEESQTEPLATETRTPTAQAMDVDAQPETSPKTKFRVSKRKQKTSGIVFPKYSDRATARRKKTTKHASTVG